MADEVGGERFEELWEELLSRGPDALERRV